MATQEKNSSQLFTKQVFICVKCLQDECPGKALELQKALKKSVKEELSKKLSSRAPTVQEDGPRIRINQSGCLGPCERGINAVCYPEGKWWHALEAEDLALIQAELLGP